MIKSTSIKRKPERAGQKGQKFYFKEKLFGCFGVMSRENTTTYWIKERRKRKWLFRTFPKTFASWALEIPAESLLPH